MWSGMLNVPRAGLRQCAVAVFLLIMTTGADVPSDDLPWAGEGRYRLIVRIKVDEQQVVDDDERPAELQVDLAERLQTLDVQQTPDLSTLQVIQHDSETGHALRYGRYAYGHSEFDRPFRWYDDAIPYEFPEMADAVSRTQGRIVRKPQTRTGYFYNVLGDWQRGRSGVDAFSRKGRKIRLWHLLRSAAGRLDTLTDPATVLGR